MANAKWNIGTESGILRKKVVKENHEDLLVFGYACKLFRDDEKALYVDQGKHLIPWMGDNTLKIDRYDCRGALSELLQYEANREDYDTTRWLGLSESERRIELLCDEERYYSLKHNDEELEMYKEEELKRLHQKGSEVQYNYDVPTDPENSQEPPETPEEEEDEVYVPSSELNVPDDMEVPKTVKENARIEKTAMFINKQGPQMEILIKTKQADNPQFSFMNKDDPLFIYYKHLLAAIKSGQYKVQSSDTNAEQRLDDSNEQDGHEDYYLHPSLFATSLQSAPTPMPTVIYKPSADCTYSQLVNRIQGTQSESATPPPPQPAPEIPQTQMTYDQQQQYYQQYYYAAQYYEYYKQMAQQLQGQPQDKVPQDGAAFAQAQVYAPGQGLPNPSQLTMQNFMQNQAAYMQYLQQQSTTNNPYAQIVSNLSQNKDLPAAYPGLVQPDPNQVMLQNSDITKAPILYSHNEPQTNMQNIPSQNVAVPPELVNNTQIPPQGPQVPLVIQPEVKSKPEEIKQNSIKKPLLSLAQYGSDSENENGSEDEDATVKIPPGEMQQIIDKMASYVLKNGKDFESIVKSKGDPRFEFLNENHEYHPYYRLKTKESSEKIPSNSNSENGENKEVKEQHNGTASKPKEKKIITPVSFSIKKPKDEAPKEIKSALPVEESDEDQEDDTVAKTPPTAPPPTISTVPTTTTPTSTSLSSTSTTISSLVTTSTAKHRPTSRTPPPKDASSTAISSLDVNVDRLQDSRHENKELQEESAKKSGECEEKSKPADSDDLILEMIDLTDDLEERRETKRAENRKKDKIAAAAREKLALQLERKKKAAAFLKLKSVETSKVDTNKSDSKNDRSSKRNSERSRSNSTHESSKRAYSKKVKSSKVKDKNEEEVLKVDDSESEEGEIKKHKKSSKKKKSHKRKHSRSRHESKSRHKSKEHKKSKKRRKRSQSCSSHSSVSSQ